MIATSARIVPTDDMTKLIGWVQPPGPAMRVSFSPDDTRIYTGSGSLFEFNTASLKQTSSTVLSDAMVGTGAVVETRDRYIFVATASGLKVYPTKKIIPPSPPHTLSNVSTRLRAQTGDNVAIGGFIIEGGAPKKVIVRAIGPSLTAYGVASALADPVVELHASDGRVLTSNDNWNAHRSDVLNSKMPPAAEREAAIVATLDPGAYTAIVRGLNNTSGVALVEVFDLSPESASRVTNISTRGKVETGDNVMIGGFVVAGDQPTKVLVRAAGPSLTQYGVAGALADTTLDLFDGNGTKFASNDDWAKDQAQEISDSGHAPSDGREAALVRTLQPGAYTAIVRGKDNTTGVALVEIYNLEPPASAQALP